MKEHMKFKGSKQRRKMLYIDYANMAAAYDNLNPDSAEFYALRSIAYQKEFNKAEIHFSNGIVLGNVAKKKNDFQKALLYYQSANFVKGKKNHINAEILYQNLIDIFNKLSIKDSAEKYQKKLDNLKLSISERNNLSLKTMLEKNERSQSSSKPNNKIIILTLLICIICLSILLYFYFRQVKGKNQITTIVSSEKESIRRVVKQEEIRNLLEKFMYNDISFMPSFTEIFPEFNKNILTINPRLVQTEIEFCAALKLKISTKDIAKYKNIEIKTVQNKKYLIRKKLNISSDIDIYHWFDKFI